MPSDTSKIDRKPVGSRNIRSVGYDAASQRLHVEFHSGGVYEYAGVSPREHGELMKAESMGKHFAAHVRGRYKAVAV